MGRVKVPIGLPCPFWKCLRRFSTAYPHYADNSLPSADSHQPQPRSGVERASDCMGCFTEIKRE